MKLSKKIIETCKKQYKKFNSCKECVIEKECFQYRSGSIQMYEEFKKVLSTMENKIK